MKLLRKTLWAIDIDADHTKSIEKVRSVACEFGNDIILLSVLSSSLKQKKGTEASVRSRLQKISQQISVSGNYIVEIRVEYGNIAKQILKVAEEEDVNVIFLNRGKTQTLGENALKVFLKSVKPVKVMSESEIWASENIVCPVDFSETSAAALSSAILHSRKSNSKLTVISVFKPQNVGSLFKYFKRTTGEENEVRLDKFEDHFSTFISKFDLSDLDVNAFVLTGNLKEEIVKTCKEADVLYIGCHAKSALSRAFHGSVCEEVINEVKCDVFSIRIRELFKLHISKPSVDVEEHYRRGNELIKLGYLNEAVQEFRLALRQNDLHIPSMTALSLVFSKMGDEEESAYFNDLVKSIKRTIHHRKIEEEIRKNLRSTS